MFKMNHVAMEVLFCLMPEYNNIFAVVPLQNYCPQHFSWASLKLLATTFLAEQGLPSTCFHIFAKENINGYF